MKTTSAFLLLPLLFSACQTAALQQPDTAITPAEIPAAAPTASSPTGSSPTASSPFQNPYENVNWENIGYHDANLHTHTNLSDGRHDPHHAIDKYHDLDYEILALTDHDFQHHEAWPHPLYPWTELNAIYHRIKDQQSVRFKKPYREVVNEEWQNRDPRELGMVSIPGSEISRTDHISSLFNEYAGVTNSEETAFQEIAERNGLAVFNHPGRYNRDVDWYVDHFTRHPHVVGMEVYNQVDRFPVDRKRWDSILHRLMPERPVWGLANDDTHGDAHYGRNRNIFLLTDLSEKQVYSAMKNGHFYFFVPVEQGVPPPIRFTGIEATENELRLQIEGDYEKIDWITYNPETDTSEIIANGPRFSIDSLPEFAPFVRAVVISPEGRTYTQPFGIKRQ